MCGRIEENSELPARHFWTSWSHWFEPSNAASWLESLEGLVQPSTVEAYAGRLQRHVLPRLGERRLDEIDVDDTLALISHPLSGSH